MRFDGKTERAVFVTTVIALGTEMIALTLFL